MPMFKTLLERGAKPFIQDGKMFIKATDEMIAQGVPEILDLSQVNRASEILEKPKSKFGSVEVREATQLPAALEYKPGLTNKEIAPLTEDTEKTARELVEARRQEAIKNRKVAGIAALPMSNQAVDMNPLDKLKGLFSKYNEAKDYVAQKAASQMDLTKDKSATQDIANTLGIVADPMNLIPGAAGAGVAAADIISSFGGKTPEPTEIEQMLAQIPENKFKKTRGLVK